MHKHAHTPHVYIFIAILSATHFVQVAEDVALHLAFTLQLQPISEPKNLLLQCKVFWRNKNSQT